MNDKLLNQVAKQIGSTDKNTVISVAIMGLVDLGKTFSEAYEIVFGSGEFSKLAASIQSNLQA